MLFTSHHDTAKNVRINFCVQINDFRFCFLPDKNIHIWISSFNDSVQKQRISP